MAVSRNKLSTEIVGVAVRQCLMRHDAVGLSLVVGYSGGLDSTVLLHALTRAEIPELLAVHVHHGLSPHADAWAQHCMEICREWGVPSRVVPVNVERDSGSGIEAAARQVRRQALLAAPGDYVLLAHHAGDQAETVLHNLIRGASVRGAAGIPELKGRVLRPLLDIDRSVLEDYAATHSLRWIEDDSNADVRFTRNFLRREVLPALSSRFPGVVARLSSAARSFGEAQGLLDELASLDLGVESAEFPLPLRIFQNLPEVRARNLLSWLLHRQGLQLPDGTRLREFTRQLREAAPDRHPSLSLPAYELYCAARQLHLTKR